MCNEESIDNANETKKSTQENGDATKEDEVHAIIDNNKIEHPVFSFIYTINLDGKIDIQDDIIKSANCHADSVGKSHISKDRLQREVFYTEKEKLIKQIFNVDRCGSCCTCATGIKPFTYDNLNNTARGNKINHFMARAFLRKAVLGYWDYETRHDNCKP